MIHRTNKILIGKDISRDAQVVAGATIATISASTGLADGEVVVLDKYKNVLAAGATIADSDTIYICQGTSETFSYTNEAGTTTSTNRRLIFSDPIQGKNVRSYTGESYEAKAEKTAAVTFTGMTLTAGVEYIVRIVYKDIKEHPGQFTQTYRHVATATSAGSVAAFCDAIVALINSHKGRRVDATDDTTGITLTGREISSCCTGLTDIDKFSMVDFDVYFLYVASSGAWTTINSTSTTVTYTATTYGNGNWEQIRDLEKAQLGNVGITNLTHFPVLLPTMSTVVDSTYHTVVIEHDVEYRAPNNQGYETRPVTTIYANVVPSSGTQLASVLAQLNPWMASTPRAFDSISF